MATCPARQEGNDAEHVVAHSFSRERKRGSTLAVPWQVDRRRLCHRHVHFNSSCQGNERRELERGKTAVSNQEVQMCAARGWLYQKTISSPGLF